MGTGKEIVSQKWLPEKKLVPKYGYRKRIGISNIVNRKLISAKKQDLQRYVYQ